MGSQETIGMHFVPETYLKKFGFLGNGKKCQTFCYNKIEKKEIKAYCVSNICKERHIYLMEGETVEERQCVEDFYQKIEKKYDYLYKILTDDSLSEICREDHELVILFVITLLFRTQKLMSQHNAFLKESFTKAQIVASQIGQNHFRYGNEIVSFQDKTLNQVLKETAKKHNPNRVSTQLSVALRLFDLRKDNAIQILRVADENFSLLTSDNPVCIINNAMDNPTLFNIDTWLTLAIDDAHLLILHPKISVSSSYQLTKNFAGEMKGKDIISNNIEQYVNAERFIISKEKRIIEETLNLLRDNNSINSFILEES